MRGLRPQQSPPCSFCSRRPGSGSSGPGTWWGLGRTQGTRRARPAPSCRAARTEPCRTRWAGRRAGSTDSDLELREETSPLVTAVPRSGAPGFGTHSEAGPLCSGPPSAPTPTGCRETPRGSSPRSPGSRRRGRDRLDSP